MNSSSPIKQQLSSSSKSFWSYIFSWNLWKDVPKRLATIFLGFPVLWMIWSHDLLRGLFFQTTHVLTCLEFSRMTDSRYFLLFPAVSGLLVNLSRDNDVAFLGLLVGTAVASSMFLDTTQHQIVLQGLFILTIPFRTWLIITSDSETGFGDTVNLLVTVWTGDTWALIWGRIFGNRVPNIPKMLRSRLRSISPKKSVEGLLLGGLLTGALAYGRMMPATWRYLEGHYSDILPESYSSSLEASLSTGLLLSAAAVAGDLWESCIKRQYGIKDTGKLIPGHGGVLDRFDSSLVTVVVYRVLVSMRRG